MSDAKPRCEVVPLMFVAGPSRQCGSGSLANLAALLQDWCRVLFFVVIIITSPAVVVSSGVVVTTSDLSAAAALVTTAPAAASKSHHSRDSVVSSRSDENLMVSKLVVLPHLPSSTQTTVNFPTSSSTTRTYSSPLSPKTEEFSELEGQVLFGSQSRTLSSRPSRKQEQQRRGADAKQKQQRRGADVKQGITRLGETIKQRRRRRRQKFKLYLRHEVENDDPFQQLALQRQANKNRIFDQENESEIFYQNNQPYISELVDAHADSSENNFENLQFARDQNTNSLSDTNDIAMSQEVFQKSRPKKKFSLADYTKQILRVYLRNLTSSQHRRRGGTSGSGGDRVPLPVPLPQLQDYPPDKHFVRIAKEGFTLPFDNDHIAVVSVSVPVRDSQGQFVQTQRYTMEGTYSSLGAIQTAEGKFMQVNQSVR